MYKKLKEREPRTIYKKQEAKREDQGDENPRDRMTREELERQEADPDMRARIDRALLSSPASLAQRHSRSLAH